MANNILGESWMNSQSDYMAEWITAIFRIAVAKARIHAIRNAYMYTPIYIYVYTYIYVYMYTPIYIYECISIHIYRCTYICMHTCIHISSPRYPPFHIFFLWPTRSPQAAATYRLSNPPPPSLFVCWCRTRTLMKDLWKVDRFYMPMSGGPKPLQTTREFTHTHKE